MNIHDYRNYSNMNNGEIKQTEAFYKSLQLICMCWRIKRAYSRLSHYFELSNIITCIFRMYVG